MLAPEGQGVTPAAGSRSMTVTPDLEFRVSPKLRQRWVNGRAYYALEGPLRVLPHRQDERPDPELLEWHAKEEFVA